MAATTDPCKYTKYLTTRSTGAGYFDRPRVSCYYAIIFEINTRFSRDFKAAKAREEKNARDVLVDTGVVDALVHLSTGAPLV